MSDTQFEGITGELRAAGFESANRSLQKTIQELRTELAAVKAERNAYNTLVHTAVGWMYAEACAQMDDGKDIRTAEVPELLDRMFNDLKEIDELNSILE